MLSLLIFRPEHESGEGYKVFQFGEVKDYDIGLCMYHDKLKSLEGLMIAWPKHLEDSEAHPTEFRFFAQTVDPTKHCFALNWADLITNIESKAFKIVSR